VLVGGMIGAAYYMEVVTCSDMRVAGCLSWLNAWYSAVGCSNFLMYCICARGNF
jgi:hypothetical protein